VVQRISAELEIHGRIGTVWARNSREVSVEEIRVIATCDKLKSYRLTVVRLDEDLWEVRPAFPCIERSRVQFPYVVVLLSGDTTDLLEY